MKAAFQKEISELTSAKLEAETELKEVKAGVSSLESKNREQAQKLTSVTKELESLKKDMARAQKGFESQLALA